MRLFWLKSNSPMKMPVKVPNIPRLVIIPGVKSTIAASLVFPMRSPQTKKIEKQKYKIINKQKK